MPIDVQKALPKIVTLPPVVLDGSLDAISSKSDLHRLILCAALSPKPTRIRYHAALSEDIRATIEVLCALGAEIFEEPVDSSGVGMITVTRPLDAETAVRAATLDCGESAGQARFVRIGSGVLDLIADVHVDDKVRRSRARDEHVAKERTGYGS